MNTAEAKARPRREPFLDWLLPNLFRLYAYHFIVTIGLGAVLSFFYGFEAVMPIASMMWMVGGFFAIPGMLVWLSLVSLLPTTWHPLVRRGLAVATGPVIEVILLYGFLAASMYELALLFGIVLPACAGFVIRLRR